MVRIICRDRHGCGLIALSSFWYAVEIIFCSSFAGAQHHVSTALRTAERYIACELKIFGEKDKYLPLELQELNPPSHSHHNHKPPSN